MVENAVVKDQLTDAMAKAGAELTRLLRSRMQVDAALWLFLPEVSEWRLIFASPDVSTKGPRAVYELVRIALAELGPLASAAPLSAVGLLDSDSELVQLLRRAIPTENDPNGLRLSKRAVSGHFVDDALIYRVA